MKKGYRVKICCLAAAVMVMTPFQAAAGPEFAHSEEEWAQLRDDKLEFDEISDLIHEYNTTVLQNRINYKEYRDEDSDDIAQSYYDAAEDIYSNIEYPDADDNGYAGRLSSALNSEMQADRLMEQGDKNVTDDETVKLGYDQTEMNLVKTAQTQMVNYWTQVYNLEKIKSSKELAEQQYQSMQVKAAAGTATQAQLLSAKEAVSSAEASVLSAESALKEAKQSLCLMTGWSYGAQVEIGTLPEPDLDRIDTIDPEADLASALDNNYSLKIIRKQISNAKKATTKENLEESLKSGERNASASVRSAYQSILLSKSNYEQALKTYELEQKNMETAERKLAAGTITRNAYEQQKASFLSAETGVKTGELSLLQVMLNYDWAVGGLASTS